MCSYFPHWRFVDHGLFWEEQDAVPERIGLGEPVLMQYTGLKDKNGVEIYEGDIVGMFGKSQLSEVFWGPNAGGWMVIAQDSGASPVTEGFLAQYLGTAEVIGNIYENPELLKAAA